MKKKRPFQKQNIEIIPTGLIQIENEVSVIFSIESRPHFHASERNQIIG